MVKRSLVKISATTIGIFFGARIVYACSCRVAEALPPKETSLWDARNWLMMLVILVVVGVVMIIYGWKTYHRGLQTTDEKQLRSGRRSVIAGTYPLLIVLAFLVLMMVQASKPVTYVEENILIENVPYRVAYGGVDWGSAFDGYAQAIALYGTYFFVVLIVGTLLLGFIPKTKKLSKEVFLASIVPFILFAGFSYLSMFDSCNCGGTYRTGKIIRQVTIPTPQKQDIRIQLIDTTSEPLANTEFYFSSNNGFMCAGYDECNNDRQTLEGQTDAQGYFTIPGNYVNNEMTMNYRGFDFWIASIPATPAPADGVHRIRVERE